MELKRGGKKIIFDDEDAKIFFGYTWFFHKGRSTYYLKRNIWKNYKCRGVFFHRQLMNSPNGLVIDHINGNGLDNRRSNLRVCTRGQNRSCGKPSSLHGRRFKGAYPHQKGWVAKIHKKYIGAYKTEEEAARAYNKEATKRYGVFARLNEV